MVEVSHVKLPSGHCHLTAPSHYQSKCWPSFMSPYGVTRPQWVNTYHDNFILWNIDIFTFPTIFQHWDGMGDWNPSSLKTRTYLSCKVNNMVADALATIGGRTSTAMVSTAWRHQAITWTNIDLVLLRFCCIHLRAIPLRVPELQFGIMILVIILLKWLSHFPGGNELINTLPQWRNVNTYSTFFIINP